MHLVPGWHPISLAKSKLQCPVDSCLDWTAGTIVSGVIGWPFGCIFDLNDLGVWHIPDDFVFPGYHVNVEKKNEITHV